MSYDTCGCGHSFVEHDYKKNENNEMIRPCTKCSICDHFTRLGWLSAEENRVRKQNEYEQARREAEEDAKRKAEIERLEKEEKLEKERKEQKEKERLEKEQLEKEQKQKEQLEKEQKFKKEHEIQSLFHICHIDNLSGIIEKGLFSRIRARLDDCEFVDIADQGISGRRDVYNEKLGLRLTTFASTYFEPMNGMYWRVIPNEKNEEGIIIKEFPEKIVIVEFKLDLSKEGIVITDGNAAEGTAVKTSYDDHSFVKIMSEIQEKTINVKYQGQKKWSSDTQWEEHKRRKAAECLVPEKISRDCITSIHVYNDPETISTATHLKDNSGLRINLKTIDKWQMRIKRE